MSLKGLECPVSKLVKSDTRPRPTAQVLYKTAPQQSLLLQVLMSRCSRAIIYNPYIRYTAPCHNPRCRSR